MGFIANAIKYIDQFGFSPTLTVNTFRSEVGSLCTVLALFFFGVYTFMTMNQYMFGQPVVMKEMVDIHSDASPVPIMPQIGFQVVTEGGRKSLGSGVIRNVPRNTAHAEIVPPAVLVLWAQVREHTRTSRPDHVE